MKKIKIVGLFDLLKEFSERASVDGGFEGIAGNNRAAESEILPDDLSRSLPYQFNEMATSCHPKKNGGKYPMWIRVEYTDGEHEPPHAHLYSPEQKPSKNTLITKFLITRDPPRKPEHLKVMRGKPSVPPLYADLIIQWAREKDEFGINNWTGLRHDWRGLADSF